MFQSIVDVFAKSKLVSIFVWAGFIYLAYNSISSGVRTTNFLTILITIPASLSFVGFVFFLVYRPWFELMKVFTTEIDPPEVFLQRQRCQLGKAQIKGGLNVGIFERKLYLSNQPPLGNVFKPLLIDLESIPRIELEVLTGGDKYPNFTEIEKYKFYLGEPTITTLVLSKELIEKLEKNFGEPIFTNKLTETS